MLSADEAKEMAEKIQSEKKLDDIEKRIAKAAAKGKFFIDVSVDEMNPEVSYELQAANYKVMVACDPRDYSPLSYTVRWDS